MNEIVFYPIMALAIVRIIKVLLPTVIAAAAVWSRRQGRRLAAVEVLKLLLPRQTRG